MLISDSVAEFLRPGDVRRADVMQAPRRRLLHEIEDLLRVPPTFIAKDLVAVFVREGE